MVQTRSACTLCAISAKVAFSPNISPNRVKAIVTDRKVMKVRIGLRRNAAQTSGRYFIVRTIPPNHSERHHCNAAAGNGQWSGLHYCTGTSNGPAGRAEASDRVQMGLSPQQ